MTGFVKAHRVRFEHHLFKAEPWCRGYAWDWMVSQAAWRDHRVSIKGRTIAIRRGQFTASVRYMADRFGWGKSSVDRFLTRLKAEAMIGTSTDDGQLVITICNYDRYQSIDDNGEVSTGTASGTRTGQSRRT